MLETPLEQSVLTLTWQAIGFVVFYGLTYFAWLRLLADMPTSHPVMAFLFTVVQLLAATILLGLVGELGRKTFFGLNLVFSLGLVYVAAKRFGSLRWRLPRMKLELSAQTAVYVLLGVIGVGVLARGLWAALFNLPSVGDDLFYHIPQLFHYVVEQKIVPTNGLAIWQDVYPRNFDLLYLPAVLWFKTDTFLLAFNVLFTFAGYLLIGYGLCRNFAGRFLSLAGGLLLFTVPAVAHGALTGYVDHLVNLFYLLGLLLLIEIWKNPSNRLLHLSFFLNLALIFGGKYSALYAVLFFLVAYVVTWAGYRRRNVAWGSLGTKLFLATIVLGLLIGPIWHIRNYRQYGNPFAPQAVTLFGQELFRSHYPSNTIFDQDPARYDQARTPGNNFRLDELFAEDKPTSYSSLLLTYFSFPPYYFLNHNNQLGPLWAYLLFPASLVGLAVALLRRNRFVALCLGLAMLLYLIHPLYLLQTTRYTSFITWAGVGGLLYLLSLLKNRSLVNWAVLGVLIASLLPLRNLPLAKAEWIDQVRQSYKTGEYYGLNAERGSYLYCYDFIRLRIRHKRIAYINTGQYAYTYHLYGKTLTNRVFNYSTLDPEEWKRRALADRIDLIVLLSHGTSTAHQPLLEMLKSDPTFKPLRHVEPHYEDLYSTCRWDFVYKVQYR